MKMAPLSLLMTVHLCFGWVFFFFQHKEASLSSTLTNKITTIFAFSLHSFLASLPRASTSISTSTILSHYFCRDRNLRSKKLSRPLLNHHRPEDYSEGTNRHPISGSHQFLHHHHHTTEASPNIQNHNLHTAQT